ncbi:VIT domain-containing protein [Nanoarchaeota archaeon]
MKLTKLDVKSRIINHIAEVLVVQEFTNTLEKASNAIYKFPLPENAAVFESIITIGKRKIVSKIKEREEARKIYEKAREEGRTASLLEQQRPNLFTQMISNVQPKEKITVEIRFFQELKSEDNKYEYVFPLTATPRFTPEGVEDKDEITQEYTEEISKNTSIEVDVNAGKKITLLESKSHNIKIDENKVTASNIRRNKDFVLTFSSQEDEITNTVITHIDGRGKFFLTVIQPPLKSQEVLPKEMIFVLDDSGSMSGWPLMKAKETMKYCIKSMNKNDTFNLMSFSNSVIKAFDKPVRNTEENIDKALKFLVSRTASGGTNMLPAVRDAMAMPFDKTRLRIVCFMSDLGIGNEFQIINEIQKGSKYARFFTFGVGSAPNRYLTEMMAKEGRGETLYVSLDDSSEEAAKKFYDMIGYPLLKNIEVSGLNAEIYPSKINDLWSNKSVVIVGKANEDGILTIKADNFEKKIPIVFDEKENQAIAMLWARQKIDNITAEDYIAQHHRGLNKELEGKITKLALEYHLVSQYTSLIAEDSEIRDKATITSTIPLAVPEGVDPYMSGAMDYSLCEMSCDLSPTPMAKMSTSKLSRLGAGINGLLKTVSIPTTIFPYGELGIKEKDLKKYIEGRTQVGVCQRIDDCLKQVRLVGASLNITAKLKEAIMKTLGNLIKKGALYKYNVKLLVAVAFYISLAQKATEKVNDLADELGIDAKDIIEASKLQ